MTKILWMPMVAAITCAMTLAACTSSTRMAESTGQYIDSTAITSKVKTALLATPKTNMRRHRAFHLGLTGSIQLSFIFLSKFRRSNRLLAALDCASAMNAAGVSTSVGVPQ